MVRLPPALLARPGVAVTGLVVLLLEVAGVDRRDGEDGVDVVLDELPLELELEPWTVLALVT